MPYSLAKSPIAAKRHKKPLYNGAESLLAPQPAKTRKKSTPRGKQQDIIRVADFFAGIGAMRLGVQRAGGKRIQFVYSNDFDAKCQATYEKNFGKGSMTLQDINKIKPADLPDFDLLLGGFPCQAFSLAGRKGGFGDPRGAVFFTLVKILKAKKPKAFLLENVAGLVNHNRGQTMHRVREELRKAGYHTDTRVLNSRYFGVPQNRPRVYIVGFLKKADLEKFTFPKEGKETKFICDILEKKPEKPSESVYISQKYYEGLERHRKRHQSKGNGFGYMVIDKKGVANTLVLGGMGRERNLVKDRPIKVWQKGQDKLERKNRLGLRKLTIRECARCQGLPDTFTFPVAKIHAYRQIANAVSVPVVRKIAKNILGAI